MIFRAALSAVSLMAAANVMGAEPMSHRDSMMALYNERRFRIEGRCVEIYDSRNPKPESLYRVAYHPRLGNMVSHDDERRIMAEIDERYAELGKDSLSTAEMFYIMKPYFEYLRYEDPHYRVAPMVPIYVPTYGRDRKFNKLLRTPAFDYVCINDTLIVNNSLEEGLQRGDMITAVNGISASRLLEYTYDDRYNEITVPLRYFHYSDMADTFNIEFTRNGTPGHISTKGMRQARASLLLAKMNNPYRNIRICDHARCGYIRISRFYPDNRLLVRTIHKAMVDFRKRGCTDVILDLRHNTGGNGADFDLLMSIFIDRPVIKYCSGQRIMVSHKTRPYYDRFTEDMDGQVVELNEDEYVREFPTIGKMYVGGMNLYVMMSRNTGSIAASFCNMIQYNNAGKLVGEPLMHNALKYGETVYGKQMIPVQLVETSVSTVEIDEYTRAADGVLQPDIVIPYVAADYLTGRDAMLDRLMEIITRSRADTAE